MKITSCKSAVLLCATCFLSAGWAHARLWLPDDAATPPAVWFDADDASTLTFTNGLGTNYVTQWRDKSGNDNHLAPTNAPQQLKTGTRTIGSLNALEGTASTRMSLASGLLANSNAFFVAWVAEYDGSFPSMIISAGGNVRWGRSGHNTYGYRFADGGLCYITTSTASGAGPTVDVTWQDDASAYGSMNGTVSVDVEAGRGAPNRTWTEIPGEYSQSASLDGALGEVIVITADDVSTDTRQKIEGYLAWKWGQESKLPVGHPYESGPPTIPDGTLFLFE